MWRSNFVLCTVLLVAQVVTQAGCSKNPTKDEPPNKLYQSPEEVFDAFMAASAKEDWKGMCECLTDETRDKLAAGLILAGAFAKGFAKTEEEKARLKPVEDVLARHGIQAGQAPPRGPRIKADFEKAMMKAVESIEDRNAFIADFLAASKQTSDDPKKNPFAGQFFDFKDVKLTKVKIQEDSATGVAVAKREGKEARQPLNFKNVRDGWKIEFPERGTVVQGGKDGPTSETEKAVVELVKKLRGRVTRDRELPGQPITEVSLATTKAKDDDVKVLARLPQLREVHLNGTQISDAALKALAPLKQLRVLNVMGTRISDAGLSEVRQFTSLQEVRLSETEVTDAGLKHLTGLPELQDVWLRSSKITDVGLQELARLTKLRRLELSASRVTDAGLKALAVLQELESLHLSELPLTDAGVKHLTGLKKLGFLTLGRTQVTDTGLKDLASIASLRYLSLNGTRVTDDGMKDLGKLAQLQYLDLEHTKVSNAGLKELAGLKGLERLQLFGTAVNEAGVAQLAKVLPNARITR